MTGAHHQLIDLLENLRGEEAQVVLDRLQVIPGFVLPSSVPEHLPEGVVMVGEFLDAVVISVES